MDRISLKWSQLGECGRKRGSCVKLIGMPKFPRIIRYHTPQSVCRALPPSKGHTLYLFFIPDWMTFPNMWLDWMFKNDITPSWKVTSFSLTMSKNHESPPQRNPTVLSHDRPLLNHILETLCELYMWWWRSFHRKEIFSVHDATAKLQKRTDVSTLYSKRITDLVILTFIWIYLFIKFNIMH